MSHRQLQIRTDLPQVAVRDEIGDSFEVLVVSMHTELGHPYLGGLFVAGYPVVPRRVYVERGAGEVRVPDGRGDLVGRSDVRMRAGAPTASVWGGTNSSRGTSVRACTRAPIAMTAPATIVAPCRTVAPVPTYTQRSSAQPSRVACGPTKTWSPSCTAGLRCLRFRRHGASAGPRPGRRALERVRLRPALPRD